MASSLLGGWHASAHDDVTVFENDSHGQAAVRASGTEPVTRLYLESDPVTTECISAAFSV